MRLEFSLRNSVVKGLSEKTDKDLTLPASRHYSHARSMVISGARVEGDRIVLVGTTVEEVRDIHRDTLKLAVEKTNRRLADLIAKRKAKECAVEENRRAQREQARKIAGEIDFSWESEEE